MHDCVLYPFFPGFNNHGLCYVVILEQYIPAFKKHLKGFKVTFRQ